VLEEGVHHRVGRVRRRDRAAFPYRGQGNGPDQRGIGGQCPAQIVVADAGHHVITILSSGTVLPREADLGDLGQGGGQCEIFRDVRQPERLNDHQGAAAWPARLHAPPQRR
jgi:hypothetical protein